jgi:hypothetical protein
VRKPQDFALRIFRLAHRETGAACRAPTNRARAPHIYPALRRTRRRDVLFRLRTFLKNCPV